jgi:hypothetical protein
MDKIKIYIASPYSNGNKEELVKLQRDAVCILLKLGFNPYWPLATHYIATLTDIDKDFPWLTVDEEWVKVCDLMIRLHPKDDKGKEIESPGAKFEEECASKYGIPCFNFDTLEEMKRYFQTFVFEK